MMDNFQENIKIIIKLKGYKTTEIAKKIGITHQQVSRWVNDKSRMPNSKALYQLAEALEVPVGALLNKDVDDAEKSLEWAQKIATFKNISS